MDWAATQAAAHLFLRECAAARCASQAERADALATVTPFTRVHRSQEAAPPAMPTANPSPIGTGATGSPTAEPTNTPTLAAECVNKAIAGLFAHANMVPDLRGRLERMGDSHVTCKVGDMEQLRAGELNDDDVKGRSGWYMQGVEVTDEVHRDLVQQVQTELSHSPRDVRLIEQKDFLAAAVWDAVRVRWIWPSTMMFAYGSFLPNRSGFGRFCAPKIVAVR